MVGYIRLPGIILFRWLHLLYGASDAAETLKRSGVPSTHVQGIISQIYDSPYINRQKYSEIKGFLSYSGLNLYHVEESIRRTPDDFILSKLVARGWSLSEPFGVYSADFI